MPPAAEHDVWEYQLADRCESAETVTVIHAKMEPVSDRLHFREQGVRRAIA